MSRHTSYRGTTIDMDTMRRENEKVVALGNMRVNAKGDQLGKNGTITKTADQIARENHRIPQSIAHTGLKGPLNETVSSIDSPKPMATTPASVPVKATARKTKETELPSGDILVEDDGSNDI